MSYVINFLEAFIASYGLVKLCDIKKEKLFYVFNIIITLGTENLFDSIDQNFISLLVVYEVLWFLIVSLFTNKLSFRNLYVITMVDLISGMSATLPIMFIYGYSPTCAGLAAKVIQFFLTYGFIRFRKKFEHFESSYWIMILVIIFLGNCISTYQDKMVIANTYTIDNVLTNIFIVIIMLISLYFFHLIEESNIEKERITKLYEKEKYQDLTYSFMKATKDELDRFEHLMTYKIRLVKTEIENKDYDKAIKLINNYSDEVRHINYTVYTGNGVFDTSMMLKLKELNYDVSPCFTISNREFYDNVQFVNLILELLDVIQVKSLNLMIKEEKDICVVQCAGKDLSLCFEKMERILNKKTDLVYRYKFHKQSNIDLFALKIRMESK